MVALSQSQKKTAFAGILIALIAVGVMVSGRGGFSGLRSDAFNNPSFVCSEATQEADKGKYDRAGTDIATWTAEKTKLETLIQKWSSEIRKNETLLKKLEREDTVTKNKKLIEQKEERIKELQKNLEANKVRAKNLEASIALYGRCEIRGGGRAGISNETLADCNKKKEELRIIQKRIQEIQTQIASDQKSISLLREEIKKVQEKIAQAKSAIAAIGHGSITNAQGQIQPLEEKILKAKNYRADYETCKRSLEEPSISCTDSDGGADYGIRGSTTLADDLLAVDTCTDVNTLTEYICPSPSGWGVSQTYTCPHGCSEGACAIHIPLPVCGNGIKEGAEQCDDGNTTAGDTCSPTCMTTTPTAPTITLTVDPDDAGPLVATKNNVSVLSGANLKFNWSVENATSCTGGFVGTNTAIAYPMTGWTASHGTLNTTTFTITCSKNGLTTTKSIIATVTPPAAVCGNGTVETGEVCDLAANNNKCIAGDICVNQCSTFEECAECGNGSQEGLEQCDDGNTTTGDTCSPTCMTTTPTAPVISLTVDPDDAGPLAATSTNISVLSGANLKFSWSVQNATSCTGGFVGTNTAISYPMSGWTASHGTLNTTTFTITCSKNGVTTTKSIIATVTPPLLQP